MIGTHLVTCTSWVISFFFQWDHQLLRSCLTSSPLYAAPAKQTPGIRHGACPGRVGAAIGLTPARSNVRARNGGHQYSSTMSVLIEIPRFTRHVRRAAAVARIRFIDWDLWARPRPGVLHQLLTDGNGKSPVVAQAYTLLAFEKAGPPEPPPGPGVDRAAAAAVS